MYDVRVNKSQARIFLSSASRDIWSQTYGKPFYYLLDNVDILCIYKISYKVYKISYIYIRYLIYFIIYLIY